MVRHYVPEAGDIVWLHFDPQAGHEQAGHRPAVVVSPSSYNGKTGLMLCCPMTTQIKGYPFDPTLTPPSNTLLGKPHGARRSAILPKRVCI